MEKVEKETGGRVDIKPYWGGALMGARQAYIELAAGVADIGEFSGAYMKEGFDLEKANHLIFYGVSGPEEARRLYYDARAKFPEIDAEFKDVKIIARPAISPYQLITTNKAVRTVEDLAGLTLKAAGTHAEVLTYLGAEGVPTPMSETYIALQKGTLDGALAPYETLMSFRFAELVKYVVELNLIAAPTPHRGMNWDTWNSLPPDIQKVFEDNIEWHSLTVSDEFYIADVAGIQAAKDEGAEFIKLPAEELKKYHDAMAVVALQEMAKMDAKGLPGTALYEYVRGLID